MSEWDVAWNNAGGGTTKIGDITDGLSNTLAVVEKQMTTGAKQVYFHNWGTWLDPAYTIGNNFSNGASTWGVTDTQPDGIAYFGCNCKDPAQTWDNQYGQWWLGNCYFKDAPNPSLEYFQPPQPRPIPSQQNVFNIYPFNAGNIINALLCDGSVRTISTSVSVAAWSAAVTPRDGQSVPLDQ
jgi:hypothetical protein